MTRRNSISRFSKVCRVALIVAIAINLAGCGTPRLARLPGPPADAAQADTPLPVVTVGAPASAKLWTGRTITGEVTAVTDSSVTLGRVGNYGFEEHVILACDIAELKAEDRSSPAYAAATLSSALTILMAAGAIALFASIGHISSN